MTPTKGFFTSEFVVSAISILATAGIAMMNLLPDALSKLPAPWGTLTSGLFALVAAPIIGWITTHYVTGRNDLKKLAASAGAAATPASLNK